MSSLDQSLGFPRIDADTMHRLSEGLRVATSRQGAYREAHDRGTFKAVREEVPRIHRALVKLAVGRGTRQAAIRSLEDAIQSARTYCPGVFEELDAVDELQLSMPVCIYQSAFERHVDQVVNADPGKLPAMAGELSKITAHFLDDMKTPGKGGARKQARRYIDGLHELAREFEDALPAHQLSADPNSLFYRYALHWLSECMAENVRDPERHIRNALAEYVPTVKTSL